MTSLNWFNPEEQTSMGSMYWFVVKSRSKKIFLFHFTFKCLFSVLSTIVCSFSLAIKWSVLLQITIFRLPLWYLQTFLIRTRFISLLLSWNHCFDLKVKWNKKIFFDLDFTTNQYILPIEVCSSGLNQFMFIKEKFEDTKEVVWKL
jgi:hypothetical protein